MTAMNIELRALSLTEVLDAGFQLVKNRAVLLGGISFLGQVPSMLIFSIYSWMLDPFAFQGGALPDIGAVFIVSMGIYILSMLLLLPFVVATITAAVGDLYLGAPVSFESSATRRSTR